MRSMLISRIITAATAFLSLLGAPGAWAQYPECGPLPGYVDACGRHFSFVTLGIRSADLSSSATPFVFKCPYLASHSSIEANGLIGHLGAGTGDPAWRTCANYDQLGECVIGETTVHFTRVGQAGVSLKSNIPLTMTASRSTRRFPDCSGLDCERCSAEFTAFFVFDDAAGFASAPTITAIDEIGTPACSADGTFVTSMRSLRLTVALAAAPLNDPAYATALNANPNTRFSVKANGVPLATTTSSYQRNDQAMDVLVYQADNDSRLLATLENVAFDAQGGSVAFDIALPLDLANAQTRPIEISVVLRSRTTNLTSAASSSVHAAMVTCKLGPPPRQEAIIDEEDTSNASVIPPLVVPTSITMPVPTTIIIDQEGKNDADGRVDQPRSSASTSRALPPLAFAASMCLLLMSALAWL
jgi:hypothetical protein